MNKERKKKRIKYTEEKVTSYKRERVLNVTVPAYKGKVEREQKRKWKKENGGKALGYNGLRERID